MCMGVGLILIFNAVLYWIQKDASQFESGASFQMGTLSGIGLLGCIFIYRYHVALKNDQKLKLLYIEEHDERKTMIKQKMAQSAIWTSLIVLLVLGGAVAYVDREIAITLIASAMMILVIMCLFKFYYLHKYQEKKDGKEKFIIGIWIDVKWDNLYFSTGSYN